MRARPLLWMALATAMIIPAKGRARTRAYVSSTDDGPPQKQQRRRVPRLALGVTPVASPCGKHTLQITGGAIFVDGRRVHPAVGSVQLLSAPVWRRDGGAVAWLERRSGQVHLMVLPALAKGEAPLPWTLPALPAGDQVFWAGRNRVVVGRDLLQPRAVASWTP